MGGGARRRGGSNGPGATLAGLHDDAVAAAVIRHTTLNALALRATNYTGSALVTAFPPHPFIPLVCSTAELLEATSSIDFESENGVFGHFFGHCGFSDTFLDVAALYSPTQNNVSQNNSTLLHTESNPLYRSVGFFFN